MQRGPAVKICTRKSERTQAEQHLHNNWQCQLAHSSFTKSSNERILRSFTYIDEVARSISVRVWAKHGRLHVSQELFSSMSTIWGNNTSPILQRHLR